MSAQDSQRDPKQLFSKDAYDMAWQAHELYDRERLTLIRYYFVAIVPVYAGLIATVQSGYFFISAFLSIFGIVLSFLFNAFSVRIKTLVDLTEAVLKTEQEKLSKHVGYDAVRFIERGETAEQRQLSYSRIMRRVYYSSILFFTILFAWSAYNLYTSLQASSP